MNTASFVADRRIRNRKKFQLPNRSDYVDNYKENNSDNAQLFSEESLFSKRDRSPTIVLRLSDSQNYNIEDRDTSRSNNISNYRCNDKSVGSKTSEKSEVIIISDSSDNEEFPSRRPETSRFATNTFKNIQASVSISSSTDESDTREDFILKNNESKKVNHDKGRGKLLSNFKHNISSFKTKQRCSILYTSDDTASTASSSKSQSKSSSSRKSKDSPSSLSHVSPTPRSVGSNNSIKSHKSVSKYVSKQVERLRDDATTSGFGTSPSFCSTKYQKVFPRKISNRGTQLTKLDALKILKAVKSKRVKYFSPSSSDKSQVSETPDSDEEIRKDKPKKSNIIEETDSEVDEVVEKSIIQNTPEISQRKTSVSRFLETPVNIQEPAYNDLSERKRKEIANWLMTNSPDSKNESSLSHISESNRNSLSSGNSSLERLEANFETPNNRDKFKRKNIDDREVNYTDPKTPTNVFLPDVLNGVALGATDKRVNTRTPHKSPVTPIPKTTISTVKKRQTKIDDYLRKTKTSTGQYINELTSSNKTLKKPPSSKEVNTEDVRIEDCVDILDKLYGDTWRAKADAILSEPRRKPVSKKDRGVQTERKVKPRVKGRLNIESDSEEDFEFGKFVKNIKPTLNSTKRIGPRGPKSTNLTRRTKPQESYPKYGFINDESSSGGSGRSSYYTALTNPLLNNKKKPAAAPASASTLRVMAICDPETDEEAGNGVPNFPNDKRNRRKLSFSDSDNDSGTSEFDPEDIVPPKTSPKKNVSKTAQRFLKSSVKSIRKVEVKKAPSFLASLSTSVPMSSSHPEARVYKGNFKKSKEALCKQLFSIFNEKVFDKKLPDDMLIEWSTRMTGTAGFCYNKKSIRALGSVTRSSRIVLATKICDNPERVRDTLVHEMCHAATWIINEISEGHGPLWKGWAAKAMKAFPELPHISRCHDYQIKTKYTYKCTTCGYCIGRHSKSLDIQKKRCGYCYGKFEVFVNRTTKSGTVQKTPSRTKDPSAFALFVKENYSSVKQNRRSMKHGEVMKVLGQQFSAVKIANNKKQDDIIEENENNLSE